MQIYIQVFSFLCMVFACEFPSLPSFLHPHSYNAVFLALECKQRQPFCFIITGLQLIRSADYFSYNYSLMSSANPTKTTLTLIALLLLITLSLQQAVIIRNLGCKSYEKGVCSACAVRYYLDSNNICQPVNPNCNTYNTTNGACLSCYPGFGLIEDTCLPGLVSSSFDPNCNTFKGDLCVKCSFNYYINSNGKCQAVDPSCKTYDTLYGNCLSCFAGFEIVNGSCLVSKIKATIPNCNQVDLTTGKCAKCSFGYYFDQQGNCNQADPNCKNFDTTQLLCTACYSGYTLNGNNSCVKSETPKLDPNCAKYDANNVCQQCSKGSFFNNKNICIVVDPSCLTFDQSTGNCLSCYQGFTLSFGTCEVSNITAVSDPNCRKFLTSDVCSQCSDRYYIGTSGFCTEVNPLCHEYDQSTGLCITCFPGFALSNGLCNLTTTTVTDPNCKTWNGTICLQCAFGAYFSKNGICQTANPLCKSFDMTNGNCLSCYDSFDLVGGDCVKNTNQTVSDPNCAQFLQGICTQCSAGYIFQSNGLCGVVSSNCKTFDTLTGKCLTCYLGFSLENGACVSGNSTNSAIDPNCAAFAAGACVRCSKNFFFGVNGSCTAVDPLCQTFDPSNGNCLTCYQSYVLSGSICIEDKNNTSTDGNCASWLSGICTSCASRTFMNSEGKCENVNINCNTYDSNSGACTSCYAGFALSNGTCSVSASPNSCSKFDSNGKCILCGQGSYLSQGQCLTIDPQCAAFDVNSQSCNSCYPGYSILNGVCQISKVDSQYAVQNCYAYDSNNQCIKCFDRFFLASNTCAPVSVFCKTYDGNTGNCLTCYTSFTLSNGKCAQ